MGMKISVGKRQNRSIAAAITAGLICSVLAAVGFSIVLGDPAITGGIPLLPNWLNQTLGRITFGAGAAIATLIALYAFREAFILYRERRTAG